MTIHKINVSNIIQVFQYQEWNECKNWTFCMPAVFYFLLFVTVETIKSRIWGGIKKEMLLGKKCICCVTNGESVAYILSSLLLAIEK